MTTDPKERGVTLLPCPWCGEKPVTRRSSTLRHEVACGNDDCMVCIRTVGYNDLADAITAWNRRVVTQPDAGRGSGVGEWQQWAMRIGKLVGCLASSFPDGNDHIERKVAALAARTDGGGGWIACSERMPDSRLVLVAVTEPGDDEPWITTAWHNERGWHGDIDTGEIPSDLVVTHWMPIPTAPARDGEAG